MSSDSISHARGGTDRLQRYYPLIVAGLAVAAYCRGISGEFVYDDPTLIQNNPWVSEPGHLWDILSGPLFGHVAETDSSHSYYRPVPLLVFRAIYAIFGAAPAAFHAVSILLHVAASILVLRLARHGFGERPNAEFGALLAASLYAVHPGPSEAVTWISGMMDVLAVTFGLITLVLLLGPDAKWRRLLGAFTWLVALLSKEIAVVVPAILVLLDLFFRPSPVARRARWWIERYLALVIALGIYVALRLHALPLRVTGAHAGLGALDVVASGLSLLGRYVALMGWPATLNVVHPFTPTTSLIATDALLGAVCLAVLGAIAWIGRRHPIGLGAAWFLLALAPALYVPMLGKSAFAERYAYLATAGFAISAAGLGLWAHERTRGTFAVSALRAAAVVVIGAALLRTAARQPAWSDEFTLWSEAARIDPEAFVARYNLGAELLRRRQAEDALPHLQKAVSLRSDYAPGLSHLGIAYAMTGRNSEALGVLTDAARRSPRDSNILHNLGLAQRRAGMTEEAMSSFQRALELNPSRRDSRAALERLRRSSTPSLDSSGPGHP